MPIEFFGVMIPILAIVMGISLGFYGVWTSHQQKLAKYKLETAKVAAGDGGAQARELTELRERVGVLERIVTDGGYDLATRIEALRDPRRVKDMSQASAEADA